MIFLRGWWLVLLVFTNIYAVSAQPSSWGKTLENRKGVIEVYWYTSEPFIFTNANNELTGIEYDIMQGLTDYVKQQYDVELTVNWIKDKGFKESHYTVKDSPSGVFGASAFSITEQRLQEVDFSVPYMPDISSIITSRNIPIVKSLEEFDKTFSQLTAITIEHTTYERDLENLKNTRGIDFNVEYIPSSDKILRNIAERDSAFGYLDLPLYLIVLKNNVNTPVIRQNMFALQGDGYGIILPKGSDWLNPLNEYMTSGFFKKKIADLTDVYLEKDVYDLVINLSTDKNINADEQIILLTKEKEIQSQELLKNALQIQKDATIRNIIIAGFVLALAGLFIGYRFIKSKEKIIQELELHKSKIEKQQKDIANHKQQLEEQNIELIEINKEKNNLIKILAHDLKSPINQIAGLANLYLLDNPELKKSQKDVIDQILNSSNRLRIMIGKILDVDAIEARELNINMDRINLAEVLDEVVDNLSSTAKSKEISIIKKYQGEFFINGDEIYISQIFQNLISNSIKFSNAGSEVVVDLAKNNGRVMASIVDQGPGFTEDDQNLMFKKFQRLSAKPTAGEESTGLGLSIVKLYTELMKGEVSCTSTHGKGATFTVSFKEAGTVDQT